MLLGKETECYVVDENVAKKQSEVWNKGLMGDSVNSFSQISFQPLGSR